MPSSPRHRFTRLYTALCLAAISTAASAEVPWNLKLVNADVAHRLGYTGSGIVVGVIDSGLDINHPAFAGRIDPRSRDFIDPFAPQPADPDDHGTHVAGIIAAGRNTGPMYGIAYDATLLDMRAIGQSNDDDDDDDEQDDEDGKAERYIGASTYALRYAAEQRLKVINGSYGPDARPPKYLDPDSAILNPDYQILPHQVLLFNEDADEALDLAEYEAIEAAAQADVVMVFAAGNEYAEQPLASSNPSGNGILPYIRPENHDAGVYRFISYDEESPLDLNDPDTYEYLDPDDPRLAELDYSHLQGKLIAVVATDQDRKIASYSNRCGVAWQWCMAAPGGNGVATVQGGILSTVPYALGTGGYAVLSGTSMASPLVAGAAALVRSAFPYLDASQTIELLLTTTNRSGHLSDKAIYGRGMLDIGRAVLGPREFGAEGFAPVFDVDTQGYTSTWAGDIIGSGGLTKRGNGMLSLTGNNSYVGATTIAGGSLRVEGSIARSAVLVQRDALLTGSGTVGTTRVAGTIAPAATDGAIAALTVDGDYQQVAGSTMQAELGANGDSTQLRVRGTADVQGGTLRVHGITPHSLGKQYAVIQTEEGVTGGFDDVPDDYLFIGLNAAFQGNRVALSVDRQEGGFASVAQSRNQRAVARGVDGLDAGHAVFDRLIMSTDASQARYALDRLSGDIHPSLLGVLASQSSITRDALTDRGRLAPTGQGVDVWGRYTGSRTHLGGDGNAGALRNTYHGAIFGADTDVSNNTRLGLAFGFGSSSADVSSRSASAKIDNYTLGAYGNSAIGIASLRYGAAYSWHHIDSRRDTWAGESRSKADYHARSAQAFVELATSKQFGSITLEPFVGLAYVDTRASKFDEGGDAGLAGERSKLSLGYSTLGLRAGTQWTLTNQSTLGVDASVGWLHALGNTTPTTNMSWQRGASFTSTGLPVARNTLAVQTGLTWQHNTHASLNVSYQGQFGQRTNDQGVSVNARWRF